MKKIKFLLIFSMFLSNEMYGQSLSPQVNSSAGGDYTSSTHQLSWTMGEPIIDTWGTGSNTLTQGFHQTRLVVTSVTNVKTDWRVSIYPNPTIESVQLELPNALLNPISLTIVDVSGRLIHTQTLEIGTQKHRLNFSSLLSGMYFLELKDSVTQSTITYKIKKI